jgi:hypothetical protein
MGRPIARRTYRRSDRARSRVVLELGMPRKVPGWDWGCPVRITGIDWHPNQPRPILGIDALQTLELAMQYARATLMAVKPPLLWLDSDADIGLSRTVPSYLPTVSLARIDSVILRESKRFERGHRASRSKANGARKRGRTRRVARQKRTK